LDLRKERFGAKMSEKSEVNEISWFIEDTHINRVSQYII
jgi:hypothetical protein